MGNRTIMEKFLSIHDITNTTLSLYIYAVFALLMKNKFQLLCRAYVEFQELELGWTLVPMVRLLFIIIPSLKLLYLNNSEASASVKAQGISGFDIMTIPHSDMTHI